MGVDTVPIRNSTPILTFPLQGGRDCEIFCDTVRLSQPLKNDIGSVVGCSRSGGTRDGVLPILALLCLARERGCKVSQLSQDLPARYTASDRLQNFPADKSQSLIARLIASTEMLVQTLAPQSGSVAEIDQTDSLRVTFASGDIVHLRPSGNAPELRCYAEASSSQRAKLLCDECLAGAE